MITAEYSVEKGREFGWASLGGGLASYRVQSLEKYLVGTRILDAGCGGGGYVDHLTRKGLSVVGIDAHESMLAAGRELGFQGEFLTADMNGPLPFSDKSFDTSYCFDVLEHVDDEFALCELARVTRKRIILTVPREDTDVRPYGFRLPPYVDPTHLRYYTLESVKKLAESVSPRSSEILDEVSTKIELLVRSRVRIKSRYRLLTPLYEKLFRFLLDRCVTNEFYLNFLAVVDVDVI